MSGPTPKRPIHAVASGETAHDAGSAGATGGPEPGRHRAGGHAGDTLDGQGSQDGHGDHEAHGAEELGPVDWPAWGAGALGVVIGLAMALCFALATSGV